jgi:hypothetical protein
MYVLIDAGFATSKTTAAITLTKAKRCAPANIANVPSPNFSAETESAFQEGGDVIWMTIVEMDRMKR